MDQIKNQSLLSVTCEPGEDAICVVNPATGKAIAYIPSVPSADIVKKIAASKTAQKAWQSKTAAERAAVLQHWYQLMVDNQDDLARIMTLEQGKPLPEARGEIMYGASFIQWFAEEGKRVYGDSIPTPAASRRLVTIKQAVGVAAAITPWNFPVAMITRKAAPALAAGCSFIVKPANQTPLSAYAVAELAYQAGLPKDLLVVVNNHSSVEVGNLFCQSDDIKKLSFTGSTQVGAQLIKQCADTIKRTSMELGGNAPFIVFDDADIDDAVKGAIASKFRNAGQTCVCANRFYIHDAVYDEFLAKFETAVRALKVGDGLQEGVDIGPLVDEKARDNVLSYIAQAVEDGAQIVCGGQSKGGLFVEPTILTNVKPGMDILNVELFGPIAPIVRFFDDDDLIVQANDTIYGLASYFYTNSIKRAFHIAEQLEYGMVGINEGLISNEVAPFGGVKQSGFGREGGKQGIEEYLNTKYLCFGAM